MNSKSKARAWWKELSMNEQIKAVEDWKKITKNERKKTGIVLIASDDNLLEVVYKELDPEKDKS